MITHELTPAQVKAMVDLLARPHSVHITLHVLDLSGRFKRTISTRLLDGTVDIDSEADITRSMKLSLLNVDGDLGAEFESPNDGGIMPTRMIRCFYGFGELGDARPRYNVPIFTGPIMKATPNDWIMDVECQGKEALLGPGGLWTGMKFPKGKRRVDIVVEALRARAGERSFLVQSHPSRIGAPLALEPGTALFPELRRIMKNIGLQLFYDGLGRAVIRVKPKSPVFTFTGKHITEEPQEGSFSLDALINAVRVIGGAPKGFTGKYVYVAFPEPHHPLSPQTLAVNGVPRIFPTVVEDSSLNSVAEVQSAARYNLNEGLVFSDDAEFSGLVVPFLEEEDLFRVNILGFFGDRYLKKMTIPLVGEAESSYGYLSTSSRGPRAMRGRILRRPVKKRVKAKSKKNRRSRSTKRKRK